MNTFTLTVATPNGTAWSGKVVMLSLRGIAGDLAVMAGHIPFVTSVVAAPITIHFEDGDEKHAHSEGGILTVDADRTILISGTFKFDE